MTIQRYHSWNSEDDEDGHYVAYDDYAELESAHKAALLTISQITDVVGTSDTLSISQQVTELASRCSALAAESAGLNKFIDDECYVYGPHDVEPVDAALEKPETPATDAAIANIEARGVEMFAATIHADVTEHEALEFAAQLRKEAGNGQ